MDVGSAGGFGGDVRVAVEPFKELFYQAEVDLNRDPKGMTARKTRFGGGARYCEKKKRRGSMEEGSTVAIPLLIVAVGSLYTK